MRRSAEELAGMIKKIVGDVNTDEVIEVLEDVADSVVEQNKYTKEKFDELDKSWRERYTKRFMGEVEDNRKDEETPEDAGEDKVEDISIDDLFEEEEEG